MIEKIADFLKSLLSFIGEQWWRILIGIFVVAVIIFNIHEGYNLYQIEHMYRTLEDFESYFSYYKIGLYEDTEFESINNLGKTLETFDNAKYNEGEYDLFAVFTFKFSQKAKKYKNLHFYNYNVSGIVTTVYETNTVNIKIDTVFESDVEYIRMDFTVDCDKTYYICLRYHVIGAVEKVPYYGLSIIKNEDKSDIPIYSFENFKSYWNWNNLLKGYEYRSEDN